MSVQLVVFWSARHGDVSQDCEEDVWSAVGVALAVLTPALMFSVRQAAWSAQAS